MWRIFRVRIRIRIGKLLKSAAVGRSAHETLARTDQNCLLQGGVRVGPDSLRARTGNAGANGQDRSAHGRESELLARTDGTAGSELTDGTACAHERLARTDQNCLLQGGVRVGPDSLRARTGNACANGQDRSAHGRESEQLARTDGTTCAHGRDSEPLVRTDGIACAPAHGWEPLATGRSPGGTRRRHRRRRRRAVAATGGRTGPTLTRTGIVRGKVGPRLPRRIPLPCGTILQSMRRQNRILEVCSA